VAGAAGIARCSRSWPRPSADIDAIEEMLNACRPDVPREEWHKVGTDFHVEIARLSGNKFLVTAIAGVMTRLSRACWLEVWTGSSREQAWSEHRRILGYIRSRQPDEAARESSAHVRDTRDRLLRSLDADRRGLRAGDSRSSGRAEISPYAGCSAAFGLTFRVGECLLTHMSSLRMTSDLRRQLILGAAKRCFAHHGYNGTTTKSVAAAAAISEALLFKHFPSKAALYAEILTEECEADPALAELLEREPSTATLVELVRGMVQHFVAIADGPDQEEEERLRLMVTSHLDDGEFARLLYAKIEKLIGAVFVTSLERAVAAGDATPCATEPLNLFWFAHHSVMTAALTRLPATPCLAYGKASDLERQLCEFLLRGIGLNDAAIASHLGRALAPGAGETAIAESA
jgi:AcrR family transcriptional regulator